MQGLINRAVAAFVTESFGEALWLAVAPDPALPGAERFDTLGQDEPLRALEMLERAADLLDRPIESLLEDLGTFLVSNPGFDPLRRLLRFGGVSFTDFLHSLEDLQGRTRLAVPELALPEMTVDAEGEGRFRLTCRASPEGFGHVMLGALRALADDYGALAVLAHRGRQGPAGGGADDGPGDEVIDIELHDPAHHEGRRFHLAGPEVR